MFHALLGWDDFNPPVGSATLSCAVRRDRPFFAVSLCNHSIRRNTPHDQVIHHRFRTLIRQDEIVLGIADIIGVACYLNLDIGVCFKAVINLFEHVVGLFKKFGARGLEIDTAQRKLLLDFHRLLVGTAVVVLEPVECLGLVRTLVAPLADLGVLILLALFRNPRVANAVFVVVGIGTAVGVLESVAVFRVVGTFVLRVVNAVFVVVVVRASVFVFESVLVFGNVGTLVYVVGNAVAVAIADQGFHHLFGDETDIRAVLPFCLAGRRWLDKVIKILPARRNEHRVSLNIGFIQHRNQIEGKPIHIYC